MVRGWGWVRAFSMIELVIVVAIIGVLAAIAAAKLGRRPDGAYLASARNLERLLQDGATLYMAEMGRTPYGFRAWVAVSDRRAEGTSVHIHPNYVRALLRDPNAVVMPDRHTLRFEYANGLNVIFTISDDGSIIADYSGTGF